MKNETRKWLDYAQALWNSIADEQHTLELTDDQIAELDRRLDAYESDKIKARLADLVIADIRKRLRATPSISGMI